MQRRSNDEKAVRPSVSLSNARIVTERKKDLSRLLYHTKDHLAWFFKKKFLVNGPPLEQNRQFSTDIRS